MNVKKCDKCGAIYKESPHAKKDVWLCKNESPVDLCSNCRKDLAAWYYGPMIEDYSRPSAFAVARSMASARNSQFRIDQFPPGEYEKIMSELCEEKL